MSAKAMGRVWDLALPHNKLLVLLAMADHADHNGRNIYPSTELVAWKTGYSFRQVQRVIDVLIEDGLLFIESNATYQHPTIYALNLDAGIAKTPLKRGEIKHKSGQNVTPQGCQNVTPSRNRDDILTESGMTFTPIRDDIAMSSEPTEPSMNHDDDDGDRTLAFLLNEGIGAAKEFTHLPFEQMQLDYQNRIAAGQTIPIIVKAWRRNPPTKDYHYEQQRPTASDNARRSPARRQGNHSGPSGGAELRDPGWKEREIARIQQLYPETE